MDSLNDMTLAQLDPEIQAVLDSELGRQRETLEMIASENFVPRAVLEAQGSVLTNKYAEGYPGRRYYGGCEFVDVAESLAIERAKQVFGGDYVNVQPHAGAQANAAALMAMANVGDPILGLSLAHGGHLTHGMRLNFSGKHYKAVAYEVDRETMRIEPEKVREAALAERPRVIIAGWSAYPRHLDFQAFRDIADEVGAALWVDMAHFAGLVAAGLHPNPVPFADVVTTTVHKTLGGPRSGMILSSRGEQWGKKLNTAVFPGQQGGPLMHVIAAKAIAMKVAQTEEFKDRQRRTLEGARGLRRDLAAHGQQVVFDEVTQLAHPPDGQLVEHRTLAADLGRQHVVVGADAIRRHHEKRLRAHLRVTRAALGGGRVRSGAHHGLVGSVDVANLPRAQGGPTVQGGGHNAPQYRVVSQV